LLECIFVFLGGKMVYLGFLCVFSVFRVFVFVGLKSVYADIVFILYVYERARSFCIIYYVRV